MSKLHEHHYQTHLLWEGSTAQGYEHYERAHQISAPPAVAGLDLTADPSFGGDATVLNPEALLVAAASSCQLLSFLAVAARARLDVVGYTDEATAVMTNAEPPMRITRIDLHPVVTLADTDAERPTHDRLEHWTEVAHRQCFIANSLNSEVVVHPEFRWSEV